MSLIELFGVTHSDIVRYVSKEYGLNFQASINNRHKARREEIAQRVRLYNDDGLTDFEALIENVFEDKTVQDQRKKLIKVATEQNVTRRIVDEVASLYDKPAVRTLSDEAESKRFHAEEKRVNLHEIMQEAHRLLQLCNDVLVWQFASADKKTKLRVVTPDCFDAIPHPDDATVMAGVLIDRTPVAITATNIESLPHYEIWDDTFRYLLNKKGELVDKFGRPIGEPEEHGLGRIPGVLLHKREPSDRLLDCRAGRDIISAHLGCGLLNIMIMRLSKSQGERQPVLKGNLASVAAGQRMDGETPIALPPEVTLDMLDSRTDAGHYLTVKKDKLINVGQRYGLSYEQLTYQESSDTASGKAYTARREKLTELRGEQRRRAQKNEGEVVSLMGFDANDMKVDHSEQALPQDAIEEMDLLERKMSKGLDSPQAYLKRKDPDLDDDAAEALIKKNLSEWAVVILLVRSLNAPANADANNPGRSPQQNGGDNQAQGKTDENRQQSAA
jgi:hypothetical protein